MVVNVDIRLPAGQAAPAAMISEDWAAARPAPPPPRPRPPPATPAVELTDKRIKEAVAATIAAERENEKDKASVSANQQERLRAPVLSAEQYKKFEKDFAFAKVPDCLGPDGLKFQPPRIGPVVLGGILAIPFLLAAAAKGKCK